MTGKAKARTAWWRRVGWWNLAYIAFLVLLVPFGMILEGSSGGRESGVGVMAALIVCGVGSLAFVVVNALLVLVGLARGRIVRKPLIACALPTAVIVGILMFESVM